MRSYLLPIAKRLGLIPFLDGLRGHWRAYQIRDLNAQFLREHPSFVPPPADLAFDAYRTVNWRSYYESGLVHGGCFAKIIKDHIHEQNPTILDWGCGPGRLIRHMPILLEELKPHLHAVDYNRKTIEWCKRSFPEIHFANNNLTPPLAFEDRVFDVIYGLSVFTHLSEASHAKWLHELKRILKPNGILIVTAYGEDARQSLSPEEQGDFDAGKLVVQARVNEGKRGFAAIHSPKYVRTRMFADWQILEHIPANPQGIAAQDVWVVTLPERERTLPRGDA
jgi:SAM-dependent methyltransferase